MYNILGSLLLSPQERGNEAKCMRASAYLSWLGVYLLQTFSDLDQIVYLYDTHIVTMIYTTRVTPSMKPTSGEQPYPMGTQMAANS